MSRSHLDEYWNTCTENDITPTTPKDWAPPLGWIPPNERDMNNSGDLQQQSITQYAQKMKKPPPIPRVDKAGIQEHVLAIVATCDLVRFSCISLEMSTNYYITAVSFCGTASSPWSCHLPQPHDPRRRHS